MSAYKLSHHKRSSASIDGKELIEGGRADGPRAISPKLYQLVFQVRIIGKEGRTAKAVRTILNAVSTKDNKKAVLKIVE